jgi:RNA polymerase sigma-54 factor
MPLLQPKLNLKVTQRQILTPGLMQMVSVLALNKLELKEMINAEIVENPVLEEAEESVPLLDDVAAREAALDRAAPEPMPSQIPLAERDPFEQIDFGSYFQDYLDPGFRTPDSFEQNERPSFEHFLTRPSTLVDHLSWQIGSLPLSAEARAAAEYVIGNLDEDGYLTADNEELMAGYAGYEVFNASDRDRVETLLMQAVATVRGLDPCGVAARDLRECLLAQIEARRRELQALLPAPEPVISAMDAAELSEPREKAESRSPEQMRAAAGCECLALAARVLDQALPLLLKRDVTELCKVLGRPAAQVQEAVDLIRTLDPLPGRRFARMDARLIEPDVAFVKRGEDWVVVMDDEGLPTLRLNRSYRRLLSSSHTTREVRDYVKDRYRSALQLMRNIEQRKSTILRTCESILRRQTEFLEFGVDALRPMMIKEVAEEIGVHPSTVSRAVSNKYVHTPQGTFELRFFFSEGANGPEGASTPLMLLKRKVKKFIEDEDPKRPLTDDSIAAMLQGQGIHVTRRTVAKYREDLRIPSTHQRRVRG